MFMRFRLLRRPIVPNGAFISTPRTTAPLFARPASTSGSSSSPPPPAAKMPAASSQPGAAASATSAASEDSQPAVKQQHLPLPAPPQDEASSRDDGVTTLRVGESLRLDALGPLVVNTDGSMSRVGNWVGMTAMEREATLRLLGKRNQQRLAALRAKKESEEAAEVGKPTAGGKKE